MQLHLDDSLTKHLVADPIEFNNRRQVKEAHFSYTQTRQPSSPKLIHHSQEMRELLGLSQEEIDDPSFAEYMSGKRTIKGFKSYAQCYGGHQFGHWAGQLGDGRAINIAELLHDEKRWVLQLKGSGETPYSRTADGLAVLRSSIREHLCSEAMHHLGVPTTRSLSLCLTGDKVLRDVMYDGNSAYEKGAVLCRVSPSFIRFGNFEILASRKDVKNLKILADYVIMYFYTSITSSGKQKYIDFFKQVADMTLRMVIDWQRVGFVHGVMNTDNMSILGLTIDYGPYGWLEGFDNEWTPNTTDRQQKRYRYGNQAAVAHWNLYQLANALYPLIEDVKPLEEIIEGFQNKYVVAKIEMMSAKLGLVTKNRADVSLFSELEKILHLTEIDMAIFYRSLATITSHSTIDDVIDILLPALYKPEELDGSIKQQWQTWIGMYLHRLKTNGLDDIYRQKIMNQVNPKYVLRNYMAQLAIEAADRGDYSIIEELYQLLKQPYAEQPDMEKWFAKRPEWARNKVGCSMLSCSS